MLRGAKELEGATIHATDGDVGILADLYFDDDAWTIRYLVIDVNATVPGRKILVSPTGVQNVDLELCRIDVSLDREQIESSPSADTAQPVSGQKEETLHKYSDSIYRESVDSHLRSVGQVIGHTIQARDGDIGHIQDLLVYDQTWRINYLLIDISTLWSGKKVILPPAWVRQVKWAERRVLVDLKRETVKNSPKFRPESITNQA